jgi:hypothetical protein
LHAANRKAAGIPLAAYQQLLWEAAQGDLLHNDDTHMRVLEGATKAKKGEPLGPRCRRHRKNSLFYKTQQGADVGDVYMSLIHTSYFAGADPLDYLTQLQRHEQQVQAEPTHWLPWNYRQQPARE